MPKILALCLSWMLLVGMAHADPAGDVLARVRAHGYASPAQVVRELESAAGRMPADASLDARWRLQWAIARFAVEAADTRRAGEALQSLTAMAEHEGCAACRSLVAIGRAELALSQRDGRTAERLLEEAANVDLDREPYARLMLLLARMRLHNVQGEFGQGVAVAIEAMRLADALESPSDRLRATLSLTGMNADLGDFDRAQKVGEEARKLAQAIGSRYQLGMARLQQGYVYALAGKPELQLQSLKDALAIFNEDAGNARHAAIAMANIADYYLGHGQPHQAMDYAHRAEALANRLGDTNSRSVALANMGIAAAQLDQLPKARDYLTQAIALADQIGAAPYAIAMNEELVKVERRSGNLQAALAAMDRVLALNRKLSHDERERTVVDLQEKYAADAREREIERLQAAASLRASEQRVRLWQQRLWLFASVALALVASLLVLLLKRIRRDARRLARDNLDLAHQSTRDPLTGAFNRRHAQALLERLHADPAQCAGLILLDLDLFKQINDTHGHGVGDAVLVEVARRLQALGRDRDTVVRWGGEEFVLIVPGTCAEDVVRVAERALLAIGGTPVQAGDVCIALTVSIGCVPSRLLPGTHWDDALQVADLALYLSKTWGRNRLTAVIGVEANADLALLRHDLDAAHRKGEVTLRSIEGPRLAAAEPMSSRLSVARG